MVILHAFTLFALLAADVMAGVFLVQSSDRLEFWTGVGVFLGLAYGVLVAAYQAGKKSRDAADEVPE